MTHETIHAELLGRRFAFRTAPGLFSAQRVDDGTRLLLSHLPPTPPGSVLDLGCGYGALGLPVAGAHPLARVALVDRDLLAVETAAFNAQAASLPNAQCFGSLGYRDVPSAGFDWVLCNVPARIGAEAIAYILGAGAARLAPAGELRIVVIRDLEPVVAQLAADRHWPVERVTGHARHAIFRLAGPLLFEADHESIYLRDRVTLADGLTLERPQDISEDPGHQREGLPLLLECLPRQGLARALVWRGGYGAAAITLARRGATVVAADKDLLATTYTRRNALQTRATVTAIDVLSPALLQTGDRFDLIVGEYVSAAGPDANAGELMACLDRAALKATVLWLGLTKLLRGWLGAHPGWKAAPLASRGAFSVIRVERQG